MPEPSELEQYRELIKKGFLNVEVSLKANNDQADDYSLEIKHLQKRDFSEKLRTKNSPWRPIKINNHAKLVFGTATRNSDFTVVGEPICKLVFADGRSIRLYPGDLTRRDFAKLNKLLKAGFKPNLGTKFGTKIEHDP